MIFDKPDKTMGMTVAGKHELLFRNGIYYYNLPALQKLVCHEG